MVQLEFEGYRTSVPVPVLVQKQSGWRPELMVQMKSEGSLLENSPLLGDASLFVPLRLSTN